MAQPDRIEAGSDICRSSSHAPSQWTRENSGTPRALRREIWRAMRLRRLFGRGHPWVAELPMPVNAAIRAGVKSGERLTLIAAGLNRKQRRILGSKRVHRVPAWRARRWWTERDGVFRRVRFSPEKEALVAALARGMANINAFDRRFSSFRAKAAMVFNRTVGWPIAVLIALWRTLLRRKRQRA